MCYFCRRPAIHDPADICREVPNPDSPGRQAHLDPRWRRKKLSFMGAIPQKLKALRFKSKRPPDAEAQNVVPEVGGEPVAGGGAEAPRRVVPLTASGDMPTAFSAGPCR